jgi:hypothetical protein
MDGKLLLEILGVAERSRLKDMPVIIITGDHHFFSDKYPVLRKPFSLDDLLMMVSEIEVNLPHHPQH